MPEARQNQKRTAIIYFGSQQEDYLKLTLQGGYAK